MLRSFAALALLAPLVALADERGCEIPASDCIARENAVPFRGACAAKRHYKKAMCELSISRGTLRRELERCIADPEFIGATVRNGGVGGR